MDKFWSKTPYHLQLLGFVEVSRIGSSAFISIRIFCVQNCMVI